MAWGIIERCYDASLAYVRERQQFGRPIGEFQAVQLKITDLFLKLRTVENVVFRTRVDAAERRARHAVHQRVARRCARRSRSTPR